MVDLQRPVLCYVEPEYDRRTRHTEAVLRSKLIDAVMHARAVSVSAYGTAATSASIVDAVLAIVQPMLNEFTHDRVHGVLMSDTAARMLRERERELLAMEDET
jgi:hypothetical protein